MVSEINNRSSYRTCGYTLTWLTSNQLFRAKSVCLFEASFWSHHIGWHELIPIWYSQSWTVKRMCISTCDACVTEYNYDVVITSLMMLWWFTRDPCDDVRMTLVMAGRTYEYSCWSIVMILYCNDVQWHRSSWPYIVCLEREEIKSWKLVDAINVAEIMGHGLFGDLKHVLKINLVANTLQVFLVWKLWIHRSIAV